MAEKRVVLDADAIVTLRASAKNHYLSKGRKLPSRSLYQWLGMDKEHNEGQFLRKWILKKERSGWDICAPHGARIVADNAFRNVVDEASQLKRGSGIARSKLLNRPHRKNLYQNAGKCADIDESMQKKTREAVVEAFRGWKSPETRNCIKKLGRRKKRVTPEPEDYDRLTEAILNKENRTKIVFVTGDMHFICHAQSIKSEYNIEVLNFRTIA